MLFDAFFTAKELIYWSQLSYMQGFNSFTLALLLFIFCLFCTESGLFSIGLLSSIICVEDKIRNEVYEVYLKSQKIGGDIYGFEDYMFRFMHDDWEQYQQKGEVPSLNKNDIHVKIVPLKSINKINSGIKLLF